MHYRLAVLFISAFSLMVLTACSDEVKDTHPEQPVTKRKGIFKQMTKTLEPMGMVSRDRLDYKAEEFKASALELQRLASQPWPFFTADSNYPPTKAKPAVWEKPVDFKLAQDQFQARVADLVKVSQRSDLDATKAAVKQVENSCKACHDQFRN